MSTLGLFHPGTSPLHRLPAGTKLLALVAAGIGTLLISTWWQALAALALVGGLHAVARLHVRTVFAQVRPLLFLAGVLLVFHLMVSGWERAVVVVGALLVLVLLAGLVTLTTRTTDLIDAVVRVSGPLRRVGVHPERVGLMLSLGIRSVPVVVELAQEVREAQLARGLGASPRAFAVPLLVRALRRADTLGEALVARGAEDD